MTRAWGPTCIDFSTTNTSSYIVIILCKIHQIILDYIGHYTWASLYQTTVPLRSFWAMNLWSWHKYYWKYYIFSCKSWSTFSSPLSTFLVELDVYLLIWNLYVKLDYFILILEYVFEPSGLADMNLLLPFLTFVLSMLTYADGVRWLELSQVSSLAAGGDELDPDESCDGLSSLVNRQKKICKRHVDMMTPVQQGAILALQECQYQFRTRRWNCSTVDGMAVFGNALSQGTRETSFVHSISSAGVAHAVTRSCSSGALGHCGCDRTVSGTSPTGFEWAGCSDNIAYGNAFCKNFVDARERAKGAGANRALMNLHNNEAGRRTLEQNMRVQCKCHGVSGSCELKTCWRAMPSFREVGDILKDKFDGATEVHQQKIGSRKVLVPLHVTYKPHTEQDLVYLVHSPDFCEPDPKRGSLGTSGRLCNKQSKGLDGCDLMCCGRGYSTTQRVVTERCQCKFHWCCYVKCNMCKRTVEEHRCNGF